MNTYKGLFRIYGGSTIYIDKLIPYVSAIARKNEAEYLIDAFGGGGHITLNVLGYNGKRFKKRLFNDSDCATIALMQIIRHGNYHEVYKWISERFLNSFTEMDFKACRDYHRADYCPIWDEDLDDIKRAGMIMLAKAASYTGGYDMSPKVNKAPTEIRTRIENLAKSPATIGEVEAIVARCGDSFDLLKKEEYWDEKFLKFVDPPWIPAIRATTKQYTTEMPLTRKDAAEAAKKKQAEINVYKQKIDELNEKKKLQSLTNYEEKLLKRYKSDLKLAEFDLGFCHSHEELRELLLNDKLHGVIMIGYDYPGEEVAQRLIDSVNLEWEKKLVSFEAQRESLDDKGKEALDKKIDKQCKEHEAKVAKLEALKTPFYAELEKHDYKREVLYSSQNINGEDNSVYIWYKM